MTYSEGELADPLLATKRLLLAAQDMKEARDAAAALETSAALRRPLETAMIVSYARPWTKASIKRLEDHWLPENAVDLEIHERLLFLRRKVYAHSDIDVSARGIRDISGIVGSDGPEFAVEWRQINESLFPAVSALAEQQRKRFREGARELSRRVQRFAVKVVWPPSGVIGGPERILFLDELEAEVFALVPTSERATLDARVVELELRDPEVDEAEFEAALAYAVKRLLRAAGRWWRQLRFEPPALHLSLGGHLYEVTPEATTQGATPSSIAADHLSAAPATGTRVWNQSDRSWG